MMRTSRLIDTYMKHHRKKKPGVFFLRAAAVYPRIPGIPGKSIRIYKKIKKKKNIFLFFLFLLYIGVFYLGFWDRINNIIKITIYSI